jgi:nucleotide-binding universal stress UspA family protein
MEFGHVLFPVDFSGHSEDCLKGSSRWLANDSAREVHFLYILHSPTDFSTWEGNPTEEVESRLKEFVRDFNPCRDAAATLTVVTGHPSTEICKYAADHDCDLIVMATHGRTGLAHMILGSTTEQVVRHAPCPVLTVRIRPPHTAGDQGPVKSL